MKKCLGVRKSAFFSILNIIFIYLSFSVGIYAQSFNPTALVGENLLNPTALQFGPDGRLYVSQQNGTILAYTIERDAAPAGSGTYSILSTETINAIKNGVPNHNDDGSSTSLNTRQVTGILVAGTVSNPVLYVTSSDSRIGGGASGNETNLDTNSGVLSRLTWNGNSWTRIDLVRGLPRCEENHASNGMDIFTREGNTYLLLQQGGNTNKGAPSNNFAGIAETYLSGALLIVNLTQLEAMPVYTDPRNGADYVYDLPTLNDPTREDIDNTSPNFPYPSNHPLYNATIDLGDPFGGNNTLNQAFPESGGPVQIFSPGFRNAYDVVITTDGRIFTGDNGPNSAWGGVPIIRDSSGSIKADQSTFNPAAGDYITNEFNEVSGEGHGDALHYVGTTDDPNNTYYGGHPVALRAFPQLAGVKAYIYDGSQWVLSADFNFGDLLNGASGYFNTAFNINDFNPDNRQGEYLADKVNDPSVNILDVVNSSTNGICEYTATNFDGAMQGDILTASFNETINRYQLDQSGTNVTSIENGFLSQFGSNPLDVIAQGDNDPFPGTIWSATYGASNITVFEPVDFGVCLQPGEAGYDPLEDSDSDGYSNGDEIDNGTNHCSAGSKPSDNDGDLVSDLNDADDDNDGIVDVEDVFALDPNNGLSTNLPINYPFWNNDPGSGLFGLGFTGLMLDPSGNTDYLDQYDSNNLSFGGAGGKATVDLVSAGDALTVQNSQENGFQIGINVDESSEAFTVHSEVENPFGMEEAQIEQSIGIYIGNGDQDNYMKVVVMTGENSADGEEGIQVLMEENGSVVSNSITDIPGLVSTNAVDIFISIDPSAGTAQPFYSLDGGENTIPLGTALTMPTSFLDPGDSQGMAAGLIATSGSSSGYTATWDFINVTTDGPADLVAQPDPLDFGTLGVNSSPTQLNLSLQNSGSPTAGTLTVTDISFTGADAALFQNQSSLPIVIGTGAAKVAVIEFNPDGVTGSKDAQMIITHSGDNSPLVVPITAALTDFFVISRINAGGAGFQATDNNADWEPNNIEGPFTGGSYSVNTGVINFSGLQYVNRHSSIPEYIDQDSFEQLFAEERVDNSGGAEMEFTVPLDEGNYIVNLYLGNSFENTSLPGQRVFDILIEGIKVRDDLDLITEFGHEAGGMLTFPITATDGILNILFTHEVENPLVNAIEIVDVSGQQIELGIYGVTDQTNNIAQTVNLTVGAFGGDPSENLVYSIIGQPEGLSINASSGSITGTISENALSGGSNGDGNHLVTVTATRGTEEVQTAFNWTVNDFTSFRINAGGEKLNSVDGEADWELNSISGAYSGVGYTVNTGFTSNSGLLFENRHSSIPPYITESLFESLFLQERYDGSNSPEMEYEIPLLNGDYTLNLYMGNSFEGTSEIGERIFDIAIEGTLVRNDVDLIAEFGHQKGGMLSFPVTVTDGILNLQFLHEIQNPLINAIEVFFDDSEFPPIVIEPIPDQSSDIGDVSTLAVAASGGDPQANYTYSISGQPEGIEIEPTNGQIFGTISSGAGFGGPNQDGVHGVTVFVSKPGSLTASYSFSWSVGLKWTEKDENENYTARHESSFVQAGDKFYLMGGRENARDIDIYDYTTNTWETLIDSAPFEFNHYQAMEYEGLIWIIGAYKDNNFPSEVPADFIWIFDPATQNWIQGPEIPAGRKRGSTGLVEYNDKFYIIAGNTNGHDGGYVSWFDQYDPATGEWTALTDAPRARDHFHAVVISDKLYAVGGRLSGGAEGVWKPVIPEVDVYDFITGEWSTLPAGANLPTPRAGAATVSFDDKLLVIGGEVEDEIVYGQNTDDALKITEEYDPETEEWERLADLNSERHGIQGIVSGNGIFVISGSPNRGGGNQKSMEYLGTDAPQGIASLSSTLNAPDIVDINDDDTREVSISLSGGNVGTIIRSMEISGADAADFYIAQGELIYGLLKPDTNHVVTVGLNGVGADRNAVLTINYADNSSKEIALTNNNIAPVVETIQNQNNSEGDSVNLQIEANDASSSLTYAATGLPPTLEIDPDTGLITGTVLQAGTGENIFQEENGFVMIEAESGEIIPGWSITNLDGETGLIASTNSLSNQNGGTIPYLINIQTPGVYRFIWNSFYSGNSSTDENDSWLRFPNNEDVWFFGFRGEPGSEANLIDQVQNDETNIVFPGGTSRQTPGTTPVGNSSNGFFKLFRSGGSPENYKWQSSTSDNGTAHNVYVWFVNPGVYTMEISERSAGHAIDAMALYKVDGPSYSNSALSAAPESPRSDAVAGAAENSPYTVEISVTDDGDPALTTIEQFIWNIDEGSDNLPPTAVIDASPTTGEAPLNVSFDASNSTDDVGIVSYLWEFNDGSGTTSDLSGPEHLFAEPGTFEVTLTVSDEEGFIDVSTISIIVNNAAGNEPPVANAIATPLTGDAPLEVTFDGSTSTDDVGVITYSWDFGDGNIGSGEQVEHTYEGAGVYTAMLTVEDAEGLTDTINVQIDVTTPNQAPEAVIQASVLAGTAPLDVVFSGNNSSDDIAIITYSWDFGDGNVATGVEVEHTYSSAGTYVAVLTVEDEEGLADTTSVTIQVDEPNQQPEAVIEVNVLEGEVPLNVEFTGSNSIDDVAVLEYNWDFDDGNFSAEADPVNTFAEAGVYNVVLTVTDAEGLMDSASVTITVNVPPNEAPTAVAIANPVSGEMPLEVTFTGSNSTDDVGITSYEWDFGDGTLSQEADTSHTYTSEGTYTAVLTVRDEQGLTSSAEVTIVVGPVSNQPPRAIIEATPTSGVLPLEVQFVGRNSTDDFGVIAYDWLFGDGESSELTDPVHTYERAGEFTASLTVTDEEGLQNTSSIDITVLESSGFMMAFVLENPASDGVANFRILNKPENFVVETIFLHDSGGRLISAFNAVDYRQQNNTYQIPVATLRDGLYFIGFDFNEGDNLLLKLFVRN